MYPPPAIRTSNAELLGSTTGIVVTLVVATIGLAVMLGMVYWAAAHPGYKRPGPQPRPQQGHDSVVSSNERLRPSGAPQQQGGAAAEGAVMIGEAGATNVAVHQRGRP